VSGCASISPGSGFAYAQIDAVAMALSLNMRLTARQIKAQHSGNWRAGKR
jgi:hypothetical protein